LHALAQPSHRIGVAIGKKIIDLRLLGCAGFPEDVWTSWQKVCAGACAPTTPQATLNEFMSLPHTAWTAARSHLQSLLHKDVERVRAALVNMSDAKMHLPADIGTLAVVCLCTYFAR
jgi:hypothetical protein